jgi:hypothetical protein
MTDATLHVSLRPDAEERLPRTLARGYWRTVGGRLRYDYVTLFFILVIAMIALAAIFEHLSLRRSIRTSPPCSIG